LEKGSECKFSNIVKTEYYLTNFGETEFVETKDIYQGKDFTC